MRKLLLAALLVAASTSFSFAQTTNDSRAEFFVGYSHLQAEAIAGREQNQQNNFDDEIFGDRQGLNGFNLAATGFITPNFGLTGDFSFNQKTDSFRLNNSINNSNQEDERRTRVLNFLGGPTYKFRNESRVTPFVRALAGVANTRFEAETATSTQTGTSRTEFETSSSDFAAAIGGGIDVRLSDRVDLRVFQFDYNPVFLGDRAIQRLNRAGTLATDTLENQRADNFRFSIGVVFK